MDFIILFKNPRGENPRITEEKKVASTCFTVVDRRGLVPQNSLVIGRYILDEDYQELEADLLDNGSRLVNPYKMHRMMSTPAWKKRNSVYQPYTMTALSSRCRLFYYNENLLASGRFHETSIAYSVPDEVLSVGDEMVSALEEQGIRGFISIDIEETTFGWKAGKIEDGQTSTLGKISPEILYPSLREALEKEEEDVLLRNRSSAPQC